ncbi:hypothetical protein ACT3UA_11095 [Glutamicibacter sp. 363]|uniref:hypothetical protein n=1 Tax=unclassified Glutamicibacter TaxID=2627139 RepID=UPI0040331FE6
MMGNGQQKRWKGRTLQDTYTSTENKTSTPDSSAETENEQNQVEAEESAIVTENEEPQKRRANRRKKVDEDTATRKLVVKVANKTLEIMDLQGTAREVLSNIIPGSNGDIAKTVASIISAPSKKYGTPLHDVLYVEDSLGQDPVDVLVEIASWEEARLKEAWNVLRLLGIVSKTAKLNVNQIHASRQFMDTVQKAELTQQAKADINAVLEILK